MFPRYSLVANRSFSAAAAGGQKNVAFIGLGCMGRFMSKNLHKYGFAVRGFDINPESEKYCNEVGITYCSSVADAIKDCDYIVTALPATAHVEEVLNMDGGIFKNAKKGAYVCDTSTIKPSASARFYEDAKKHDLTFLDTPMSGGVTGAEKGTLTFMVGGSEDEFTQSQEVLKGMGANFFHCGKPGTGSIAKLTNNLILGISMVATSEGMAIGEKLGICPKKLQQIMAVSTARNWCIDTYNPRPGNLENVPANRQYENGFAV